MLFLGVMDVQLLWITVFNRGFTILKNKLGKDFLGTVFLIQRLGFKRHHRCFFEK